LAFDLATLRFPALLGFLRGGLARSGALADRKIFELRAGFQFLSQPNGLGASSCPDVAFFVAVLDRNLPAFQRASPTPPARSDLIAQSRELIPEFTCPAAENLYNIIAELQERIDRH
jgi:hypothetical protein